jgi:hypothetical protein
VPTAPDSQTKEVIAQPHPVSVRNGGWGNLMTAAGDRHRGAFMAATGEISMALDSGYHTPRLVFPTTLEQPTDPHTAVVFTELRGTLVLANEPDQNYLRCPGFAGDSVLLRGWSPNGNLEQAFPASVPA